jgi:hypothetical protein
MCAVQSTNAIETRKIACDVAVIAWSMAALESVYDGPTETRIS